MTPELYLILLAVVALALREWIHRRNRRTR